MPSGNRLQQGLRFLWRQACNYRLRLPFEAWISRSIGSWQEASIEPKFSFVMKLLRLRVFEKLLSPVFERSCFGRQGHTFSRTVILVSNRQILKENSPGYAIHRQVMCTEQKPSRSLRMLEEYGAKNWARCKVQARLHAGSCFFKEDTVANSHPLKWDGALRRHKSLPAANQPQPKCVMVLDELADGGFEGMNIRWLAQLKQHCLVVMVRFRRCLCHKPPLNGRERSLARHR